MAPIVLHPFPLGQGCVGSARSAEHTGGKGLHRGPTSVGRAHAKAQCCRQSGRRARKRRRAIAACRAGSRTGGFLRRNPKQKACQRKTRNAAFRCCKGNSKTIRNRLPLPKRLKGQHQTQTLQGIATKFGGPHQAIVKK